jgi:putative transposase
MSGYLNIFQVFMMLVQEKFRPRYDARLQLLAYQVKMLRSRIDDSKIYTTTAERAELTRLGELLDHDISDVMLVVQPATYHRWLKPKEAKRKRPGRPRTAEATVNLVLQFASENLAWGYKKLHGEFKKLGIKIGITTISDILKQAGHHPVPGKERRHQPNWKKFLSSHMETLVACDFFTKPVYTLKGRFDAYVLVFIHLGSRQVFMSPATFNPSEDWVLQQARNASMWLQDIGIQSTHLIRDRDTKFSRRFDQFWKDSGTEIIKTPVRSPMANSFCECYIGKIKRECLNHFICFSKQQLDYINREWLAYYHNHRPHQGVDIGNKVLRADFKPTDKGEIKREQRLGGVISWYYRDAA